MKTTSLENLHGAPRSGIHMRSTPSSSASPPSDTKDVTYDLIWEPRSAGGMAGTWDIPQLC